MMICNFHISKQFSFLLTVIYSVTPDSGPSQLSVVTDTTTTVSNARTWNMKVYQYECSSTVLGTQTISLFSRQGRSSRLKSGGAKGGTIF